jgi:hypothetical protein
MNEKKKANLLGLVRRGMLTVALLAGLVLLFSAPSGAQSTPEKSTPSTAKVAARPSEKPSPVKAAQSPANGKTEGIKVHGHWMIEVRNPDGMMVTHREFENSLASNGAGLLATVLAHSLTFGIWEVHLGSQVAGMSPCVSSGAGTDCVIYEPGSPGSGTQVSKTLVVSNGSWGVLVFSGTAVAGENGQIDLVRTMNTACPASTSPATCLSSAGFATFLFTSATVTPAVNVLYGQSVAVTVTITFT